MLTLLLSALIAIAPFTRDRSAQADTVNRYIIDGETITAFDGSQLIGKSITDYDISDYNEKDKVVRFHIIKTRKPSNNSDPFSMFNIDKDDSNYSGMQESTTVNPDGSITKTTQKQLKNGQRVMSTSYQTSTSPVITPPADLKGKKVYIDDKEAPVEDLLNIKPADIASMTVLKGAAAEAVYGPDASEGVIVITTKKK